jgi:phosphopantothenoylcysteine decarboxylase/phosphopantothenate--cysteine ligase
MSSDRESRETPPDPAAPLLAGRRVTIAVTGSIAAYKSVYFVRQLLKAGARVSVIMTPAAEAFVGRATFAGITGEPARLDMFDTNAGGEPHVELAANSDLIVVAPATADTLAKLAGGQASDLVSATLLCATCPVLLAPAMHPSMWGHPALQRNVARIVMDGRARIVGPATGEVASGDHGEGRMLEPEELLAEVVLELGPKDLEGAHIVISAGPTLEDLDPVRFIANRSSGKMGFALAERARARGARVSLVAGPVSLPTPFGVARIDVRSAASMQSAIAKALGPELSEAQALIMCAAVSDYRPAVPLDEKLKRSGASLKLELIPNPDLLASFGNARQGALPLLVGFALETSSGDALIETARLKLEQKRVDLIVANSARDALGQDDNLAVLVTRNHTKPLERLSKTKLADEILDVVARELEERR